MQGGDYFAAPFIGVQFDIIVAHLLGRPKAEAGVGGQPLFIDDTPQHGLGIGVQLPGCFPHHPVFENVGEAPGQFPGDEERRPVNDLQQ